MGWRCSRDPNMSITEQTIVQRWTANRRKSRPARTLPRASPCAGCAGYDFGGRSHRRCSGLPLRPPVDPGRGRGERFPAQLRRPDPSSASLSPRRGAPSVASFARGSGGRTRSCGCATSSAGRRSRGSPREARPPARPGAPRPAAAAPECRAGPAPGIAHLGHGAAQGAAAVPADARAVARLPGPAQPAGEVGGEVQCPGKRGAAQLPAADGGDLDARGGRGLAERGAALPRFEQTVHDVPAVAPGVERYHSCLV
jgi:hypothetical protein